MSIPAGYQRLLAIIRQTGPAVVAFSGGVDSTLVLQAVVSVFGEGARAVLARSALQTAEEIAAAEATAAMMGAHLTVIEVKPLSWPEFVLNPAERCYCCKKRIYSLLLDLAHAWGIPALIDGTNSDDMQADRPGLKAIAELGVATPLAAGALTKKKVREISRSLGLKTWNKPSSSCLATRIPTGVAITEDLLKFAMSGENLLHAHGFFGCRLRLLQERQEGFFAARLELAKGDVKRFSSYPLKQEIIANFYKLGFSTISLELNER